jgi:lipopolysaccharide transport system ATP-binding protein
LSNLRKAYPVPNGQVIAVDGITFELTVGDRLGIVGPNGAGKSTLLQMIAGLTEPTSGSVQVQGRVTAVMTLGIGLRDHATGRENIYLDGELQGQSRADVDRIIGDVIAFSELREFIDQPVRTYSTGMKARLAFSMLSHLQPDILIIDEALSVGDAVFSRKATAKIREIAAQGRIVIVVSHSMTAVRDICNRCIWLDAGRLVMDGAADDVTSRYVDAVRQADQRDALDRFRDTAGRHSFIEGWEVGLTLHQGDEPDRRVLEAAVPLQMRISGRGPAIERASIEVAIVRLDGIPMFVERLPADAYRFGDAVQLQLLMEPLALGPGIYRIATTLTHGAERAADASIVCEVFTPVPSSGGRPMLMYPMEIDVVKLAR